MTKPLWSTCLIPKKHGPRADKHLSGPEEAWSITHIHLSARKVMVYLTLPAGWPEILRPKGGSIVNNSTKSQVTGHFGYNRNLYVFLSSIQ